MFSRREHVILSVYWRGFSYDLKRRTGRVRVHASFVSPGSAFPRPQNPKERVLLIPQRERCAEAVGSRQESGMDASFGARIAVENIGKGTPSFTLPKAEHSETGVSVEYVRDPSKTWLVLRASYGRCHKAANMLISAGHYCYIAQRYEMVERDGRRHRELKDLIPNLLFAYMSVGEAESLLSRMPSRPSSMPALADITTFYYDHFSNIGGKNPPLSIPDSKMLRFIMITMSKDANIVFTDRDRIVHVRRNDLVKVTEGLFAGCVGHVVRIASQQRVGIKLQNIGWVATSYVPTAFLEVIASE